MNYKKLLVLGSSNIDHIIRLKHFPKPGETLTGRDYQIAPGGKGANQAVAAARLGAVPAFISCIGDDALGKAFLKGLKQERMDTSGVNTIPNATTGTAMIWLSDCGENSIALDIGANNHVTTEYLERHKNAIAQAEILLIQLETPLSGVEKAITIAKNNNTLVALNPAPARDLSDVLLAAVDIITPNETETYTLTNIAVKDDESAQKAANVLHTKGVQRVFITRGKHGVYYSENGSGRSYPGFNVSAIDTTAAGDTFNGALVTALIESQDAPHAIRFAQAASALSVQRIGAQPSIPSRAEVLAFLQQP